MMNLVKIFFNYKEKKTYKIFLFLFAVYLSFTMYVYKENILVDIISHSQHYFTIISLIKIAYQFFAFLCTFLIIISIIFRIYDYIVSNANKDRFYVGDDENIRRTRISVAWRVALKQLPEYTGWFLISLIYYTEISGISFPNVAELYNVYSFGKFLVLYLYAFFGVLDIWFAIFDYFGGEIDFWKDMRQKS